MNIKDIRTRKGLTQAEVASALGVSSVVYSHYETGSRQPSIDILIQLADIFGVTVNYLLGSEFCAKDTTPTHSRCSACGSAGRQKYRVYPWHRDRLPRTRQSAEDACGA